MKRFYVMQQTETGEDFCKFDSYSLRDAEEWIEENKELFPESEFFIEFR